MPQTVSLKKRRLKAGAFAVKQVHCINRLVICHIKNTELSFRVFFKFQNSSRDYYHSKDKFQ